MVLFDYQKKLLDDIKNGRFAIIKHSRQMGITTVLVEFIVDLLIDDANENKIILFNNFISGKHMMNLIKTHDKIKTKTKDTVSMLTLPNGNLIKLVSSLDGLIGIDYNNLIVDNAFFNKDLEKIIFNCTPTLLLNKKSKFIIASSIGKNNIFFNELFNDKENIFTKHLIKLNTNNDYFNNLENFKKNLNVNDFKREIELVDVNKTENNKTHLLTFRLDTDLKNKLNDKLLKLDVSISKYLRDLIEKDT